MATLDAVARRSDAPIVNSCFGAGASILLASEPGNELNSRKEHRGLPFENLSEEKANAYFAEGIQDEILTRLCESRRFEGHFAIRDKNQSKPDDLKSVAQELGVSTMFEGAVQRLATKFA